MNQYNKIILMDAIDLIGKTPMIRLGTIPLAEDISCNLYAKCEFFNPTGSSKDRIARAVLEDVAAHNLISRLTTPFIVGGPVAFCKSMAFLTAMKELNCICLCDKKEIKVEYKHLHAMGAQCIPDHSSGGEDEYDELFSRVSQAFRFQHSLRHISSAYSMMAHFKSCAVEVCEGLTENPMMIVCGSDSEGLLYSLSHIFQVEEPKPIVIGVDLTKNEFNPVHQERKLPTILGLEHFVANQVSEWIAVSDRKAYLTAKRLIREEGLLVGPRSGAVLTAALFAVRKHGLGKNSDANIVMVFDDSYFNTTGKFIQEPWLLEKGFLQPSKIENHIWWWLMKVSDINMKAPLVLSTSHNLENVVKNLEICNSENAVIVDKENKAVGVATKESLKLSLTQLEQSSKRPITDFMYTTFKKLSYRSKISKITAALQKAPFVVIVQQVRDFASNKDSCILKDTYMAVLNQLDLLAYIKRVEKHHLESYGIHLADGAPDILYSKHIKKLRFLKGNPDAENPNIPQKNFVGTVHEN